MEIVIALLSLIALEIVLGIDNIIFISILAGKLPAEKQKKARMVGLTAAMTMRVLLLFSLSLIMKLTAPVFTILGNEISGRDIILITGGLFLLAKSTFEIHEKLEGDEQTKSAGKLTVSFAGIITQIMLLDLVFSIDSVITAIGMTDKLWVMITAVIVSVIFMMFTAGAVSDFVHKHPTVKILALSFLLLIGVALIAEGFNQHISKGFIYFAMAFSVFVEMINIKIRSKSVKPVVLKEKKI